ncbi:hypothetical protein ACR82Z_02990 [Mycoplasma sp. 6243]|uniref:hypothetical protein n=1 Tax=Mycoplasma sp. 6243 TaxID=3440865 RepID=UPI003EBB8568
MLNKLLWKVQLLEFLVKSIYLLHLLCWSKLLTKTFAVVMLASLKVIVMVELFSEILEISVVFAESICNVDSASLDVLLAVGEAR